MPALQTSPSSVLARRGQQTKLGDAAELIGRVLLSLLFFVSGVGKVTGHAAIVAYMAAAGVPAALLPLAVAVEILGALALVLGWHSRVMAVLLAGYSLVTASLFHLNFADPVQGVMFLKNLSIAGGLLLLAIHGAGRYSLDARRAN